MMNRTLKAAMLATILSRGVDARAVNIELDGVISLKVRQGGTATLTICGDADALKKVVVDQSGDTLHIGTAKVSAINRSATARGLGSVSWQ